jgi:hypothetical protein
MLFVKELYRRLGLLAGTSTNVVPCHPGSSKYYAPGGFGGASGHPTLAKPSALGQDEDLAQKLWKDCPKTWWESRFLIC